MNPVWISMSARLRDPETMPNGVKVVVREEQSRTSAIRYALQLDTSQGTVNINDISEQAVADIFVELGDWLEETRRKREEVCSGASSQAH